jgi:hypothetical protein
MYLMRSTALVLAAVLALPVSTRGADCPVGGTALPPRIERERVERQLSANAELVTASNGGKHRAVGKPIRGKHTLPIANFVDTHIAATQARDGIEPTVLAGDEEFLRRVHLDLTGAIPAPAEVTAFVADTTPDKRAKKIDQLLKSDAFVDRWTMWFGDLVQNVAFSSMGIAGPQGRNLLHTWIRDSIRDGKPYDQMVREILAAEGLSHSVGTPNYLVRQIQMNGPPQDTIDNLATHSFEKFMGMPLLCISCHSGASHLEPVNWYLRNKTRDDFWKTAAFFSRTTIRAVRYKDPLNPTVINVQYNVGTNPDGAYLLNTVDGNKSPRQPASGQSPVVAPAFLTTGEQPGAGENYRVAYGRMLTADRQFARAFANYLWKELFGLGLVEPVSSFDLAKLGEQCTHPELLEALADEVIAKNYSLREVLRTIASSSTYQLSARYTPTIWNENWTSSYARRYPRRMQAEVLLDAVATATSTSLSLPVNGVGPIPKAMQLPDPFEPRFHPASRFLDAFGRGNRDDTARTNDSAISQALIFLNDPIITQRVIRTRPGTTVDRVLSSTKDPGTIADQLYLATLSRKPTAEERTIAIDYLRAGDLGQRTEDLQFALLNSLEFLFQ